MSAGLAALAGVLQGISEKAPGMIQSYNSGVAAKNRDSVMKWAEEQSRLSDTLKELDAAGVKLSDDESVARSQIKSVGADPDAALPFEEWAKKRIGGATAGPSAARDSLQGKFAEQARGAGATEDQIAMMKETTDARYARGGLASETMEQAQAATMGSGNVQAENRTTERQWRSPTADAIRGSAVSFANKTLGREEQKFDDLDAEEKRLNKKMALMGGYRSYLSDEDFKTVLEQIKGVADARKERGSQNSSLRGDQTQLTTGLMGFDRAMEQTVTAAAARADEGEKNRELKASEGAANRASAERRAAATRNVKLADMDMKQLRFHQANLETQIRDRRAVMARAANLKTRTFQTVEQAAAALGADVKDTSGWLRKSGKLDFTKMQNDIIGLEAQLNAANKRMGQITGSSVAPAPSAPGAGKGTSGRRSLSEY